MIEYKQLFLHAPKENIIGDCFRTCVACIFNFKPISVPHFYQLAQKGRDWEDSNITIDAINLLNNWLKYYELKYVEYPVQATEEELKNHINHYYKDLYIILGCSSKNGGHSVIIKNSDYLWDPSLDNSGCIGPAPGGYYWIGLFVKDTSI